MHHELASARGADERRWTDVLLGRDEGGQYPPGITADMVVQLMQFGFDNRIILDDLPDIDNLDNVDEQISHMPSLSLIMGQETPTEDVVYSAIPLSSKAEIAGSSLAVLFSKIVANTKLTMVQDLPLWSKYPSKRRDVHLMALWDDGGVSAAFHRCATRCCL